jgi:hypothetical protein
LVDDELADQTSRHTWLKVTATAPFTAVSSRLRTNLPFDHPDPRRERMKWQRKYLIIGGSVLAVAAGGTGAAFATGAVGGGDDGDSSLTGPVADKATAAALRITGGGTANAVERDSEDGATYEVEVTKPDGNTVDVRLDENYNLAVVEGDNEDGGAETGSGQ